MNSDDTIIGSIQRIASRVLSNAKLADISPIVYLRNMFYSKNGKTVEHVGLGVRALLLNEAREIDSFEADIAVKGSFLRAFPPDQISQPPARVTYQTFLEWRSRKGYTAYTHEISTQHAVLWRYKLHQMIVNPVLRCFSKFIGDHSIADVKTRIVGSVGTALSCIDIACGDSRDVFAYLKHMHLVVANDISTHQVNLLEEKYLGTHSFYPKANTILFTTHDCLDLPFKQDAFDVSICSNLLHHMRSAGDLGALLSNLRNVARRILIIEIEDPKHGSLWDRLRHRYYIDWLRDGGEHFYTRNDFENIIRSHFEGDGIVFEYMHTIRGVYMSAHITKALLDS